MIVLQIFLTSFLFQNLCTFLCSPSLDEGHKNFCESGKPSFFSITVHFHFSFSQNLGKAHKNLGKNVVAVKNMVAVKDFSGEGAVYS